MRFRRTNQPSAEKRLLILYITKRIADRKKDPSNNSMIQLYSKANNDEDVGDLGQQAFLVYCQQLAYTVTTQVNQRLKKENQPLQTLHDELHSLKIHVETDEDEVLDLYEGNLLQYDDEIHNIESGHYAINGYAISGMVYNLNESEQQSFPHEHINNLRLMVSGHCLSGPLYDSNGTTSNKLFVTAVDERTAEFTIQYFNRAQISGVMEGFVGHVLLIAKICNSTRMAIYFDRLRSIGVAPERLMLSEPAMHGCRFQIQRIVIASDVVDSVRIPPALDQACHGTGVSHATVIRNLGLEEELEHLLLVCKSAYDIVGKVAIKHKALMRQSSRLELTREILNSVQLYFPSEGNLQQLQFLLTNGQMSHFRHVQSDSIPAWDLGLDFDEIRGLIPITSLRYLKLQIGPMVIEPSLGYASSFLLDSSMVVMTAKYNPFVELTFLVFTESWEAIDLIETVGNIGLATWLRFMISMGGRNDVGGTTMLFGGEPIPDYTGPILHVRLISVKLELTFISKTLQGLSIEHSIEQEEESNANDADGREDGE